MAAVKTMIRNAIRKPGSNSRSTYANGSDSNSSSSSGSNSGSIAEGQTTSQIVG